MARSARLVMLKRTYILYGVGNVSSYTLWGRDPENISFIASGFLLPVTYFPTILLPVTYIPTNIVPVTYFPTNLSACYILSDESRIPFTLRVTGIKPFYSTSNGYKKPFTLRVTGIKTLLLYE